MKKLMPFLLLFTGCHTAGHDGIYVDHSTGTYSVAQSLDAKTIRFSAQQIIIGQTIYQRIP